MGACVFFTESSGRTPEEAFENAPGGGAGGYTGTISEKNSFVLIEIPDGANPHEYADYLIDTDDRRISSKWGPAGCIKTGEGKYLFFGWASE